MIVIVLFCVGKILFIAFSILLLALYIFFRKQYKHWKVRNIPYAKPVFPFGNIARLIKKSACTTFKELYEESKHRRYYGIWLLYKPMLMVNDPDLIQRILIKNFANFPSSGSYFDKDSNPFPDNLFGLEGAKWKNLRAKLSPIFSSGKLKSMFPTLIDYSQSLQEIVQESARKNELIDAKDIALRFATDVVSSIVFGIEINFLKDANSMVGVMANNVLKPTWSNAFKYFCSVLLPDLGKILKCAFMPKKSVDYFMKMLYDLVEHREKNNITRSDIMQVLIEHLRRGYIHDVNINEDVNAKREKFTMTDLGSHAMFFFVAGFETSSTAMQFALYELAKNPEIQRKATKEIKDILAKYGGQMTYEAISEMEYLGRIIDETLRKYPPVPVLMRKCASEFEDPCSNLKIEKGTSVIIPSIGLHWDERYYPEPEKFDPERFTQENKASRSNSTYFPFGEGPRICMGQRLAYLQVKVGLVTLLLKFHFDISAQVTPDSLQFEPRSILTASKGKMMLKISLLED